MEITKNHNDDFFFLQAFEIEILTETFNGRIRSVSFDIVFFFFL